MLTDGPFARHGPCRSHALPSCAVDGETLHDAAWNGRHILPAASCGAAGALPLWPQSLSVSPPPVFSGSPSDRPADGIRFRQLSGPGFRACRPDRHVPRQCRFRRCAYCAVLRLHLLPRRLPDDIDAAVDVAGRGGGTGASIRRRFRPSSLPSMPNATRRNSWRPISRCSTCR